MKNIVDLFHELRKAQEMDLLKDVVYDHMEISLRIFLYMEETATTLRKRAFLGDYVQNNFEVNRIVWERNPSELTVMLVPHVESLLPKAPKILLSPDLYGLA